MIDPNLLNLLPPWRRARGDRVYGPGQDYWVDLWKQDGAWLLGRRPEGAAKEWKNQLDKGLAGWAPSHWPRRLTPLVRRLFPEVTEVRIVRNADRAQAWLEGQPPIILWRPWQSEAAPQSFPGFSGGIWPILPTGPGQAVALAFTDQWAGRLPDHDLTSPAEAAALVHGTAQVLRFTADSRAAALRESATAAFDRFLGSSGRFRRQGIWFQSLVSQEVYRSWFQAHLEGGFLLNPDPQGFGTIPWELSQGEWSRWKAVVETWTGGR